MPGVRAPLDARTLRAASASHSLLAISRRSRSNLRFGSLSAHVASLCCISLIIKGLHLAWSDSLHFKQFELFPFAMWQAFPAADYYGSSASMMDIRVNSLATQNIVGIPSCLPSFICWTSCVLVRLPVAVFFPCFPQVDADALVWLHSPHGPSRASSIYARVWMCRHTSPATSSAFRLLSRVGRGDIPALRCE